VDQSPRDLFSRDGNLWHLSHEGGNLEDPWSAPVKEMFKLTVDPEDAPATPEHVTLAFEQGTPVALNGERLGPVALVERLNEVAGAHGVGRLDLVENRLVGIKSRGVYETPAGTVLHHAHRELERLVLDRDTLHFKQSVSVRYAELIYDGLWFSTLRQALAAFVEFTEQEVTGEVRVRLFKGRAEAIGRRSPRSLYRQDLATFCEGMAYDHEDAGGFIRLFGLPERVRALTRHGARDKAGAPAPSAGSKGEPAGTTR
jgi:argininosuccinate synthase